MPKILVDVEAADHAAFAALASAMGLPAAGLVRMLVKAAVTDRLYFEPLPGLTFERLAVLLDTTRRGQVEAIAKDTAHRTVLATLYEHGFLPSPHGQGVVDITG